MYKLCVCEIEKAVKFICAITFPPRDTGLFMTVSLSYMFPYEKGTESPDWIHCEDKKAIIRGERKTKMKS